MLEIGILLLAVFLIVSGMRGTYASLWNSLFPGYPVTRPTATPAGGNIVLDPNAQTPGQYQTDANGTPYISGGSVYPIANGNAQPAGSTDQGTYYQQNQYPAGLPGSTVPPGVIPPPVTQAVGSGTYVPGYGYIPVSGASNPNLDAGYFIPLTGPPTIVPGPGGVFPIAHG